MDLAALARVDGEGASHDTDGESPDAHKMAEASIKEFFEAGKRGDFASATQHFASAMEHCQAYGPEEDHKEPDGDEGEKGAGGHALLLIPHHK